MIFFLGNQWRIGRHKSIPKTQVPETSNGFDDMWEFIIEFIIIFINIEFIIEFDIANQ